MNDLKPITLHNFVFSVAINGQVMANDALHCMTLSLLQKYLLFS